MKRVHTQCAVVFDFDGTLADSQNALLITTNRLLSEKNRRALTLQEMRPMLGGGAKRLLESAFHLTGDPTTEPDNMLIRWRAIYDAIAADNTPLYPDVIPTLLALRERKVTLGICTGKPQEPTLKLLESLGIREHFSSVFGVDSTPTPKPHPGHLLAVLADLGVSRESTVMVGDTEADVAVAVAAGVASLLVTRETDISTIASNATWSVTQLDELVPIFDMYISSCSRKNTHSG